jgi:hypothetical protein
VLDRRCRQPFVGVVDHWIGYVVVGRGERSVFPAQVERFFEKWDHCCEVVRRPSLGPCIVGSRKMGIRARNVLGRDLDGFLVVASHDAEQAGIVGGKLIDARLQLLHQSSESWIDETLVRKASQHRQLPTPRYGAAIRHVGGFVPAKDRPCRVKIVNL